MGKSGIVRLGLFFGIQDFDDTAIQEGPYRGKSLFFHSVKSFLSFTFGSSIGDCRDVCRLANASRQLDGYANRKLAFEKVKVANAFCPKTCGCTSLLSGPVDTIKQDLGCPVKDVLRDKDVQVALHTAACE